MLHPGRDGEVWLQGVVKAFLGNLHGIGDAVKGEDLVTLVSVIGGNVV